MSETLDRDPFALGGRSADTATESWPDSAGKQPAREVRIASLVGRDPASLPPKEPAMPDGFTPVSWQGDAEQPKSLLALIEEHRALDDEEIRRRKVADLAFFALPNEVKLKCLGDDEAKLDLPCGDLYRQTLEVARRRSQLFDRIVSTVATTHDELIGQFEFLSGSEEWDYSAVVRLGLTEMLMRSAGAAKPVSLGGYGSETPAVLWSEWKRLDQRANELDEAGDRDAMEAVECRLVEIEDTIASQVVSDAASILAQAELLARYIRDFEWSFWNERLLRKIIEGLSSA